MRQTTRVAILCMTAGLAAAGCSSSSGGGSTSSGANGTGTIKIGEISSLTGSYAALGKNNQLGASLAVAQINAAGGVLGKKLQLVPENDQTNPMQAITAFRTLTSGKVSAVVGSSFPGASLAVEPLAKMRHVPYISTGITDQQVQPASPYVYMTSPPASAVAEVLDQYFKATGLTKMAVAYDPSSPFAMAGWNDMKAMASQYGVMFPVVAKLSPGQASFTSLLSQVRGHGAEGLMVWATGSPAIALAQQFHSARLGPVKLIFSQAEDSPLFTSPLGAAANGVIVASSLAVVGRELPASPLRTDVMDMAMPFQKAHGRYPPQFAFDGYNAVELIAAAIRKAGSADPAAVAQALNGLTLRQTEGMYMFTPSDHEGLGTGDVAVAVVSGGHFTPTPWSAMQIKSMVAMNGGMSGSGSSGSGMSGSSSSSSGSGMSG